MRKLFLFIIIVMLTTFTFALPTKRTWSNVTLNDGSTMKVMFVGDEHGHWYVDEQGKALNIKDGVVSYISDAELTAKKKIIRDKRAKIDSIRAVRLAKAHSSRVSNTESSDGNDTGSSVRTISSKPRRAITDWKGFYSGTKRGIVILVNFSNKKFLSTSTQSMFNDMFNLQGYSEKNHIGSVHDYFHDQSYGQFDLEFDVVGPVTVSQKMSYYGQNNDDGYDKYVCKLIIEAVKLADSKVDFSKYDWDGDGEVDQVYVIYAGYGENYNGADENTIWPEESTLDYGYELGDGTGSITLDGVKINTFAVSSELANTSGSTVSGIGTACHEFSHCLGFPDTYDSSYSGGAGMLYWDLLDHGSYSGPNGTSEVPTGFTSYERWMAGWLEPTELKDPCYIDSMPCLQDTALAYIIYNDGNNNEAYMLENRQAKRWDEYVGGTSCHGMLITHVDYDEKAWAYNMVNNDADQQRMTYFPADNSFGTLNTYENEDGSKTMQYTTTDSELSGDPFPGTKHKTSFTDSTKPASILYNEALDGSLYMGKPITNIAESSDGLISFTFMGGEKMLDRPEMSDSINLNYDGFTLRWTPVEDAQSYTLRIYKDETPTPEQCLVLSEDCSKFKGTSSGGDGSMPLDYIIDQYTQSSGWEAYYVYSGPNRMKIGTSRYQGYICTPLLSAPKKKKVTVCLDQSAYSSDTYKTMDVYAITDNNVVYDAVTIDLSDTKEEGANTIINLSHVSGDYRIYCTPKKRGYIYGMKVYNGEFTADDLLSSAAKSRIASQTTSNDTIYVTGITDTQYTIKGLDKTTYRCNVKAVNDSQESLWSKYAKADISTTGIREVSLDTKSGVHDNRIFNLNGQRLTTKESELPAGIYIIRGRKVVIK